VDGKNPPYSHRSRDGNQPVRIWRNENKKLWPTRGKQARPGGTANRKKKSRGTLMGGEGGGVLRRVEGGGKRVKLRKCRRGGKQESE